MESNKSEPLSAVVVERKSSLNGEPLSESDYIITEMRMGTNNFLLTLPRGAYTGARTVKRTSIMDLQEHLNRTCNSMKLMKFTPPAENLKIMEHNDNSSNSVSEYEVLEQEPEYVTKELEPYRDLEKLKEMVIPLFKLGLKKYFEIEEETPWHIKGIGEIKVTLIVCYSFEESRPRMVVHVTPLHAPNSPRCRIEVYGEPRRMAEIKDSQWVRDRQALVESMRPGFNEIVLFDSHTFNIYEGLSSNFFAVLHNPDTRRPLVVTAPSHCVLIGTIMKIVIMICERDEIDFKFWFPNVLDGNQWKGAFITSTSRLVLPVDIMKFRDGRPMLKLPANDETVEHIKNEVAKEILKRAYPIL
ncbi:14262_t:CDS:2 [Acaulospora morrowiae]|uniref:14262_t:CDS:1 n=1 Tax=Acaulospora morrowiae TaxID=94023 RepID=A0A9N8VL85_9GLOM|nr:14262_t:CDS:2 [Acaulospora morrowiae]